MIFLSAVAVSGAGAATVRTGLRAQTPIAGAGLGAIAAALTAGNSSELESCAVHPAMPVTMPPLVDAMIHMRWGELDSEGDRLIETLRALEPLHSFAHARDTFYEHLRGTWAMLATWGQPQDVCRAGLFHTGYVRPARVHNSNPEFREYRVYQSHSHHSNPEPSTCTQLMNPV